MVRGWEEFRRLLERDWLNLLEYFFIMSIYFMELLEKSVYLCVLRNNYLSNGVS